VTGLRPVERLTVLVLAKQPLPGHSKTRLAPRYGDVGAARLAAAALADTLDVVRQVPRARKVLVLAGDPQGVDCAGFQVVGQAAGSHAERIQAAFELVDGPAVLVGMDTPQLRPGLVDLDRSAPVDAWLGPAQDGGWWAMGLRHAARDAGRVLAGVPMSTPRTGALQRIRLEEAGLRVAVLPTLRDVDEPDDARAVAALIPRSRFGRELAALEAPAVDRRLGALR
jgi:glycosyltransferase A (GT-A) superfamily protein (DUF2064 family)